MGLKPISKVKEPELDSSEEEYAEDIQNEEPETQEIQQIKKAVSKPKASPKPVEENQENEEQGLTREEVLDMITGHMERTYKLIQLLK